MNDLISALIILMKYCGDDKYPTHCEHDVLYFPNVKYNSVSLQDKEDLEKLGLIEDEDSGGFKSYRFGSC